MSRKVSRHLSRKIRAARKAIDRLFPNKKEMQRVGERLLTAKFRNLNDTEAHYVRRYLQRQLARATVFHTCRGEYLNTVDEAERETKLVAFMRIPVDDLMSLRKLPTHEITKKLAVLVDEQYSKQSGNRCGHNKQFFANDGLYSPYDVDDPYDPKSRQTSNLIGRRPQLIYEMADRMILAVFYPNEYGFKQLFMKKTRYFVKRWQKNERVHRSELRESFLKVFFYFLQYFDIRSMRIGFTEDGYHFDGIHRKAIANATGLSLHRVKEAIALMHQSGILYKTKQMLTKDQLGKVIGRPIVRRFSTLLFKVLELDERVEEAQERKERSKTETAADRAQRATRPTKAQRSNNMQSLDDILSQF